MLLAVNQYPTSEVEDGAYRATATDDTHECVQHFLKRDRVKKTKAARDDRSTPAGAAFDIPSLCTGIEKGEPNDNKRHSTVRWPLPTARQRLSKS
eukprot:IDg14325t1